MTQKAALYLRSSKDRNDVSIDAQRRTLHEMATARNLIVVEEFTDAVESGKDDDRPGFQALIQSLKAPTRAWQHILALDTSRIARRRMIALIFENQCEKSRVKIHYCSVPEADDAATTMLLKSILQALDEWHSLTSKAKGLAGMSENVRQGFRAGGRAPRGYKLVSIATGAIREGQPVLKSKLEPNDEHSLVRAYLKGRAAGEPRSVLIARLQLDWPQNSLNSMEWQALTYAGCTVWNVHNERIKGESSTGHKRKARSEWEITKDTHEAMITIEEAEAILTQLGDRQARRTRDTGRPYLLTGFLTTPEGKPWHGEWDSKGNAPFYRSGKGARLAAWRVDEAVLARLIADLQSAETLEIIQRRLNKLAKEPVDQQQIRHVEKELSKVNKKIARLVDLLTDDADKAAEAYKRSISEAEMERVDYQERLAALHLQLDRQKTAQLFTTDDVRRLLGRLGDELQNGLKLQDIEKIKAALGGLIERITLDPNTLTCAMHYRVVPDNRGYLGVSTGIRTPVLTVKG